MRSRDHPYISLLGGTQSGRYRVAKRWNLSHTSKSNGQFFLNQSSSPSLPLCQFSILTIVQTESPMPRRRYRRRRRRWSTPMEGRGCATGCYTVRFYPYCSNPPPPESELRYCSIHARCAHGPSAAPTPKGRGSILPSKLRRFAVHPNFSKSLYF